MTIFVANLAYTATEEEVRQLFEGYGTVATVRLMTDRDTCPSARVWLRRDARRDARPGRDCRTQWHGPGG